METNYPANWPEIAQEVKNYAGWRCENCDHPHQVETGYCLTVHHLDGDKSNCRPKNLVALCQRCHLRVQAAYMPGQIAIPGLEPFWMRRQAARIDNYHKRNL